jgi:hypothetical protein
MLKLSDTASFYLCVAAVYMGTLFYTLASYYHLKMGPNWNYFAALAIAIPFVLIEYTFSLHANYFLFKEHGFTPSKILILTVCFNFINIWLFNYFIMNIRNTNLVREAFALLLIVAALIVTKVVR